jgi:hypothetical protein
MKKSKNPEKLSKIPEKTLKELHDTQKTRKKTSINLLKTIKYPQ